MFWRVLALVMLFTGCVQIEAEDTAVPGAPVSTTQRPTGIRRNFRVEIASQTVGFTLMVNGVEFLVVDGGTAFSSQTNINDWMVSGNNNIGVTLSWPDGVPFSQGIGSASFKLFSNSRLLREFNWPVAGIPDQASSYPYTFTDTFRADGFPRVQLDRAERVFSSAGILPRSDQEEIADIAAQLRTALIQKDLERIGTLFKTKYEDLAAARYTTSAAIRAEDEQRFRELMGKEGYTVAFSGRNSFFSAADGRAVRLGQGRIGFPEPALIITYRENRSTVRWTMELYFAKIDGAWVIIR